jgi:hypothetical protein
MEEEVGGSGGGMAIAGAEFLEWAEFGGAGGAEEFVPGGGTEGGDAGEAASMRRKSTAR